MRQISVPRERGMGKGFSGMAHLVSFVVSKVRGTWLSLSKKLVQSLGVFGAWTMGAESNCIWVGE